MHKYIFTALFLFLFTIFFSSAKTKEVPPAWLNDVTTTYPYKDYIAQTGSGKTEEDAKTSALAAIGRIFSSKIENTTVADKSISQSSQNKDISSESSIKTKTTVTTDTTLIGVQYSEVYYYKKNKTYNCVAYLNRKESWDMCEPLIKKAQKNFKSFYNKATELAESNPLASIACFLKAQEAAESEYSPILMYGRTVLPSAADAYNGDIDLMGKIPEQISAAKNRSSFFILVQNDGNSIIESKLSSLLSAQEYPVSKTAKGTKYTLAASVNKSEITVDDKGTDSEMYSFTPVVELSLSETGKKQALSSLTIDTKSKVTAFTQKSVLEKAARQIEQNLSDDSIRTITSQVASAH